MLFLSGTATHDHSLPHVQVVQQHLLQRRFDVYFFIYFYLNSVHKKKFEDNVYHIINYL